MGMEMLGEGTSPLRFLLHEPLDWVEAAEGEAVTTLIVV